MFEFGGSFGMSLEGDCDEVEVTPYLEMLVAFGVTLEEFCHNFSTSSYLFEGDHKFLEKNSLLIRYEKVLRLK
jgi:hypothetical protein